VLTQYTWIGDSVTALAASQSAPYIFVFVLNNAIFRLTASLASWTAQVATAPAFQQSASPPIIALSSNGSVAVCATNVIQYQLLLSTDGGATYATLPSFNAVLGVTPTLSGLAISADGKTIAGFGDGYLFVSTDMGTTWGGSGNVPNATNMYGSLALSGSGNLLAIALQGGPVMLSTNLGKTFVSVGLPVPQPTAYPTKQPTPRPSAPTYSPTPEPTLMPTSAMPTTSPTPSPTIPTNAPTTHPTSPTSPPTSCQPSMSPTPFPTAPCVCPYFFPGSASVQVCQQCVQAASCCSYCPSMPAALCQTTSTVSPCPNAVTTYDACSGGSGGGGGGNSGSGDSSGVFSLSSSSMPSWAIAVVVLCVLFVVSAACAIARWRWRIRTQRQMQPLTQALNPPLPFGRADPQVLNPVFGDEGGRESGGIRRNY